MTNQRVRTAGGAIAGVLATLTIALLVLVPSAGASMTPNVPTTTPQPPAHQLLSRAEQMPAFLNGSIVNTIYLQGNFVGTIHHANATFGKEPMVGLPAIGVTPT